MSSINTLRRSYFKADLFEALLVKECFIICSVAIIIINDLFSFVEVLLKLSSTIFHFEDFRSFCSKIFPIPIFVATNGNKILSDKIGIEQKIQTRSPSAFLLFRFSITFELFGRTIFRHRGGNLVFKVEQKIIPFVYCNFC